MRLRLSEEPKTRYSLTEASLFQVLASSKKPLSLNDLALEHYAPEPLPLNWQPIVRVTLSQLMKKMELNGEPWRIEKIKTQGEKELTYQLKRK